MLVMTRQTYQMYGLLIWLAIKMKIQLQKQKIPLPGGDYRNRYPVLANFVKTVLCVPATSVPCERVFSSSGYIVSKTRAARLPENVATLVCLHDWMKA